ACRRRRAKRFRLPPSFPPSGVATRRVGNQRKTPIATDLLRLRRLFRWIPTLRSASLPLGGNDGKRMASRLGAVFLEAGHDLDEIAGAVAVVELPLENAVPGVPAGARRAGQAEDQRALGDAAASARLDGRGADGLERD